MRPRRPLPRRQHREAVRLRRGAATRRARPAVARRPAPRRAARERHRPLRRTRPTSRCACCSAIAAGSRSGTARPSTSQLARHPAKVWKVSEFLDLAAAQPPVFAPGTGFSYSNTDYNLLGLIIERITGRSWRHEVTRRVIRPLRLTRTSLPAPGDRSIKGAHAHGYGGARRQDGRPDPRRPLVRRRRGRLRAGHHGRRPRALPRRAVQGPAVPPPLRRCEQMLDLAPAQGEGGLVGYGLGHRAARPARRRRADRPPRRRGLSLLRRPRAPGGRDDDVRAERPGRPDAAGHPGGPGAHGDAGVNRAGRLTPTGAAGSRASRG